MAKTITTFSFLFLVSYTISAQSINTIAGNGNYGYKGDGGLAINAELNYPTGVVADKKGNIYIVCGDPYFSGSKGLIKKVNKSGVISSFVGSGEWGYSGDGGPAINAKMTFCFGIIVDTIGNVYFSDTYNSVVRKVDTLGIITTFAGNGVPGYSGDGGLAVNANFCSLGFSNRC